MSRRPARGQTEPVVAMVALLGVCLGVSLYAVVLGGATPNPERDVATPTLSRVAETVVTAGVARPATVPESRGSGPAGFGVNVTLAAGTHRWTAGPSPPPAADTASRPVAIRVDPGDVRAGTLGVAVWEGRR